MKVPADLHRRLKADAALKGKELGELAEELFAIGIKYSTGLKVVNGGHGKE